MPQEPAASRIYLDLTHLGRHVTGIERVSIEQFEKVRFENADVVAVRSTGLVSMIAKQQLLLPALALLHPGAKFVFPGFPPSPLFALMRERAILYVHDTFLITRTSDLSTKARVYMAPQFNLAARRLKRFFVNSEKTRGDLSRYTAADAIIQLYRPSVANHFELSADSRAARPAKPAPLRLVSLGTVEPRKNYSAALAILDALRATTGAETQLHIIGRAGWGEDAARIQSHPGVTVHGYLDSPDVKRVIENADVYLCTSLDEGLGLPLLEAQFAGLPIVAPDQPVFREVLGGSGTFIDPASSVRAAEIIEQLVTTPGWRQSQAQSALANVARWNAAAAEDLATAKTVFSNTPVRASAPSRRVASPG